MNKPPTLENIWKLYTDATSSFDGSRLGLMLVSLEGKEFTYAIRFDFKTTNNEAKYEALLIDIHIVMDMEIKNLDIYVDLQFVANQVKGIFEARKIVIREYLKKTKEGNGYHVVPPPYTGTFMPPKPDLVFNNTLNDVKTDHHAFTVNLSPTKPDQVLSLTTRPSAPIIEDWVSDSEDESETKTPHHTVIPKPTSNEKCRNRKACFVCKSLNHFIKDCNYHEKKMAQPTVRNHAHKRNYKQAAPMTHQNTAKHMVPAAVLTQSKPVPITAVRPVSIVIPKISVAKPRHAKPVVTKPNSIPKRHINRSPSPRSSNSPPRVTVVKALVVNVAQGM
nr:protein NYNRIN-like [Tanacetum cinerariifolium]